MAEGGICKQPCGESTSDGKINLVCRYFIQGVCTKGSICEFLHDKSGKAPVDNICRYYQLGMCSYGTLCRYNHVKKDDKKQTQDKLGVLKNSHTPQSKLTTQERQPQMVTLKKGVLDHSLHVAEKKKEREMKWAEAKAFVPGQKYHNSGPGSYAEATGSDLCNSSATVPVPFSWETGCSNEWRGDRSYDTSIEPTGIGGLPLSEIKEDTPLCPFYAHGNCPYGDACTYAHGDLCEMCGMPRLHPVNRKEREFHEKECLDEHEKEMEAAFAMQASEDMECGICLEKIINKDSSPGVRRDNRFGILENCNHCFCLTCIRQWRGNDEVSIETHRSCPTCRTHSDFITPSKYWVTTSEEKSQLIREYKTALGMKTCKYFKKGKGSCPFNSKCFYMHALEDGTIVTENLIERRVRRNADGDMITLHDDDVVLWDFIEQRDEQTGEHYDEELSLLLLEIFQASDEEDDD